MYPEAIINLYRAWMNAEDQIPEHEYEKGYKSRQAKARKLWKVFSEACEAEGLKPVQVASSFVSKIIMTKR